MPLKTTSQKFLSKVCNDLSLNSAKPYHFYRSQWELLDVEDNDNYGYNAGESALHLPLVSLKFLIYRGIYMLFFLSSITFSTSCQSHLFHIFLTNWSFTAQNLYAVLFFGNVFWRWWTINVNHKRKENHDLSNVEVGSVQMIVGKSDSNSNGNLIFSDYPSQSQPQADCCGGENLEAGQRQGTGSSFTKLTYLEKVVWILMNIVHVLPYCVVLGYWVVVYKYDPKQPSCEKFRSHYIVHGATAVFALVDTLVIAIPARITHFIIPSGLIVFYVVFTYLYELGGGEYRDGKEFIYSVLNWKNPSKALIFTTVGVLLSPLTHTAFCWGIHRFRMLLFAFHKKNKSRK